MARWGHDAVGRGHGLTGGEGAREPSLLTARRDGRGPALGVQAAVSRPEGQWMDLERVDVSDEREHDLGRGVDAVLLALPSRVCRSHSLATASSMSCMLR